MRDTLFHLDTVRWKVATIRRTLLRIGFGLWFGLRVALPRSAKQWWVKPNAHAASAALLVAGAYYLGALIGLSITFQSSPISPIWPPNAILLVALLLVPTQAWWMCLLAVFGAHMLVELPGGIPLATTVGLYFTNAGEAILGALLVIRFTDGTRWLGTLRQVVVFLACAIVAAPVITSFADAAVVALTRWGDNSFNYWLNWETRCVSNILAELTIGPALLLALTRVPTWKRDAVRQRWLEAALLTVALLVVGVVAFSGQIGWPGSATTLAYAVLPVLLWAAVRFGVCGTSFALLGLTVVATRSAAQGMGLYSAYSPAENVISLQLFLICISIPMLILAAVIEERQHALQALRTSEARYRDLVESQTDLVCRYLPDSTLTFVNEAYCRMYGKPREQLIGTRFFDALDPSARDHHAQYTATLLTHPHTSVDEHEVVLPDGTTSWQQWVDYPIYDAEGHLVEIQAVGRDITKRMRAEEALRESEARFRAAFESAAVGMALVGLDSHPLEVNHALVQMLGYSEEEVRIHGFAEFTFPEDVEPNLRLFQQAVAGDIEHYHLEKRYLHKDGYLVWGHLSAGVVRDVMGKPLYFVAHLQDVTKRKRAEEALQASEARYRTVVRNLPQTVVLFFDAELCHIFADGPGLQAFGLTPEGLEGRTVWETLPGDLATALAPHYEAARSGQAADLDVEYAQHIYRIQVVPMPVMPTNTIAPAQTPVGMVVLRDITEQRRARDELVRERTRADMLGALSQEFRTLAEHSPDLIARFDREGRVRYVNQVGADQLGLPAERWEGKTFADLEIPQDLYTPWDQALREVVETGAPHTFDIDVHTPEGQMRSLHVRFIPEFGDDDRARQLQSVLGIATDVSALKQAEARLATQASELEAIFSAISDGVGVYDHEGHFVRANPALLQLLGVTADTAYTGHSLEERSQRLHLFDDAGRLLPAEEWPHWRALRGEILAGAGTLDVRIQTLDGRNLWTSITGAPIHGPDGQMSGCVLVTRDVSSRHALERQIHEQASQLEAVFAAMTDGIFVLDANGRTTRMNPAAQTLFGRASSEAVPATAEERARGLDLRDGAGELLSPEQLPTTRLLHEEVFTGCNALTLRLRTHDGRERTVSLTGGPLRDGCGHLTGAVGVFRDITEVQQMQETLAQQERLFRTLVEHSPDIIARFDRELRYLYINPAISRVAPIPQEQYVGKTNRELGIPEAAYGPAHHAIEAVFQTGQSRTLLEHYGGARGSDDARYFRARILPEFAADGSVASVLTVTTEITELKRTEHALRIAHASVEAARQEEERRKRIAESLRDVLSKLNSTRSPRNILQYIVRQVEDLLGSEAAVIYGQDSLGEGMLPEVVATTLSVQAEQGLRIAGRRSHLQQQLPFADAAVQLAVTSGQPVALLDVCGLPPSDRDDRASDRTQGKAHFPLLQRALPAPYRAALVVPIRVQDSIYGCLLLFYTQLCHFSAEEVDLVQAYADQVALAISNARLQAHIEREAATTERNRLAHELHDTVTQEIFSASLLADSVARNWQEHRAEAEAALLQLPGLTRGALAGLRLLLLELRPTALDQMPLAKLLRQLGEAMSMRVQVPIAVRLNGEHGRDGGGDGAGSTSDSLEPLLPPAVKATFYRVAQEALMNAAKYAKARAISLHLRTRARGKIELEIADDGRGFDPSSVAAGHFGLAIMRERAQAVGATLQVRSQPGQGTRIVVAWRRERQAAALRREEATRE